MKVLFVASGNGKNFDIAPFIKAQGESLKKLGVEVINFPVQGRGVKGYYGNAKKIKAFLRKNPVDLIHAHYTLSGWSAVLARTGKPLVLSLMGSDAYGIYIGHKKVRFSSRYLTLLTYAVQPFVKGIISKSANIDKYVYQKRKAQIIPNGIRMEQFKLYPGGCREELGLQENKQYILFLGNKASIRKNYPLVKNAVDLLGDENVELIAPFPIPHDKVVKYLNSVDVFAMPAFMEGSPNVVKEAMACNCPVVGTDVGDVKWVLGDTEGCHIAQFKPKDFADKLRQSLEFAKTAGRTTGRARIEELALDDVSSSKKIIQVYQKALQ